MAIISLFSGIFCREDGILKRLHEETGHGLIRDADIIDEASRLSGLSADKIGRAFSSRVSVFNRFTHEKERSVAHLKLALARKLMDDDFIMEGFAAQLIPEDVNHVLRVCLIADLKTRAATAVQEESLSESEAVKLIRKMDEERAAWVNTLFDSKGPWDPSLYDIVIPTDKTREEDIVKLIMENAGKDVLMFTERTRRAVENFILSAEVEVALVAEGHNVGVEATDGRVTLTINKHVLLLNRLEDELKAIAGRVPGVKEVVTKVGPEFHKADIYRKYDFEIPSKVLLVDDEREFVQTLSERLLMRDMGSAVAYDGKSALELIKEDEPEVMILDLRMPGIDGIEVLRKVKSTQPDIEVIILTGHGSEDDKEVCMGLGAFAYLQKPVDIDLLSETIKRANERIRQKKAGKDPVG